MAKKVYNEKARFVGKRLKELRHDKGIIMQQIAEKIGVARSTYAGYEVGDHFPPIETLGKLAEVLGTSTDYIIGLTDKKEPKEVTRNVDEYLSNVEELNWNGIPLSNDDLKPLRDLFTIVLRDRIPKMMEETEKKDEECK